MPTSSTYVLKKTKPMRPAKSPANMDKFIFMNSARFANQGKNIINLPFSNRLEVLKEINKIYKSVTGSSFKIKKDTLRYKTQNKDGEMVTNSIEAYVIDRASVKGAAAFLKNMIVAKYARGGDKWEAWKAKYGKAKSSGSTSGGKSPSPTSVIKKLKEMGIDAKLVTKGTKKYIELAVAELAAEETAGGPGKPKVRFAGTGIYGFVDNAGKLKAYESYMREVLANLKKVSKGAVGNVKVSGSKVIFNAKVKSGDPREAFKKAAKGVKMPA